MRQRVAVSGAEATRKLSDEQVIMMRLERKNGASYKELSDKYRVAKSTISYIINKKTYIRV